MELPTSADLMRMPALSRIPLPLPAYSPPPRPPLPLPFSIEDAYTTGRGSIIVRGRIYVEEVAAGRGGSRSALVVTEVSEGQRE